MFKKNSVMFLDVNWFLFGFVFFFDKFFYSEIFLFILFFFNLNCWLMFEYFVMQSLFFEDGFLKRIVQVNSYNLIGKFDIF